MKFRKMMNSSYSFYRHGKIDRSAPDIIIGSGTDVPLNEQGVVQSQELANALSRGIRPELIITSPLERALETARIVSNHWTESVPIYCDKRLQAQYFGPLENRTVTDLNQDPTLSCYLYGNVPLSEHADLKAPGSESLRDVEQRITEYLAWISRTFQGVGVITVTHGSILRAINGVYGNIEPQDWESALHVSHGEGLIVDIDSMSVHLQTFSKDI